MAAKILAFRVVALPIVAALVALLGGISASFYGAALVAFVGAIVFTGVSERLLRGKLFGKIGGGVITWYFAHLVLETIVIVALVWVAFALFGWNAAGWVGIAGGIAAWYVLARDTVGSLVPLVVMYLATRR